MPKEESKKIKSDDEKIIGDFIEGIDDFMTNMIKMGIVSCPVCGLQPYKMLELAIAIKSSASNMKMESQKKIDNICEFLQEEKNVDNILAEQREMFSRHARDLGITEEELLLRKLHHRPPFSPKKKTKNKP